MRVIREDNNINTAIDAMINSFDSQDEPMLGAFWYDPRKQEVFGVKATPARDCKWYKSPQFGIETRTGNALHVNIWKKEHFRGKDTRFNGDYTQVPRGRVFEFKDKGFVVFTGDWIDDYPEAKRDIIFEFQLPEDVKFERDYHWDIGHGWSNEFFE